GEGFLEPGHTDVFIVPAEGGTPHQVTKGDFDHSGPLVWTPDSRNIILSANRNEDWEYDPVESDLFRVSIETGEIVRLTDRNGPDAAPDLSPDGRRIAYVGFDDREQGYQVSRLYVMDADGGNARVITADFDRDVESPRWSGDGRGVYFLYDDHGVRKLGHVTLDGKVTTVAEGLGGLDLGRPYTTGQFTVSRDGTYAVTVNSPHRPADIA